LSNFNLYLEFPTKIDGLTIFTDDLGLGINQGALVTTCDIAAGHACGDSPCPCYLDKGAGLYGSPARIVITGLTIASNTPVNFDVMVKITNPVNSNSNKIYKVLIPITAYTSSSH
jgi:hypothetical protein